MRKTISRRDEDRGGNNDGSGLAEPSAGSGFLPRVQGGYVKSAVRALQLLEYFESCGHPARCLDVAEALALPKSSANELLKTLTESGYLTCDPLTKLYAPSLRVYKLGRNVARRYYCDRAIMEALEKLHDITGEIAAVFAQNGHHMQFVATIPGRGFSSNRHSEGNKVSMMPSACGKAYLASKPNRTVIDAARVATRSRHVSGRAGLSVQDVLDGINLTRARGFAVSSPGLHPDGMSAVAVSVSMPQSQSPIVIGVGNHSAGREEQLARTIKEVLAEYRLH